MITIDASNTYSPGNYILLEYLLRTLEERRIKSRVFVIYEKIYLSLKACNFSCAEITKTTLLKTMLRFTKNNQNVLFFCSIPPFLRNKHSLVYFHSSYIARPIVWKNKDLSFKTKFKRYLNALSIRYFKNKVDFFACQTPAMERDLAKNYPGICIKKIPFFEPVPKIREPLPNDFNKKFDFFYPATPDVHKNFFSFFDAIELINKERKVTACVTISPFAVKYVEKIESVNRRIGREAIINVGRVEREKVIDLFYQSRALFFPSLEESFGLPIIEAAQIGCPVLISDLPYAYDVISNPITFDPMNHEDMVRVMNEFLDGKYVTVNQKPLIENKIDELIHFFTKQNG